MRSKSSSPPDGPPSGADLSSLHISLGKVLTEQVEGQALGSTASVLDHAQVALYLVIHIRRQELKTGTYRTDQAGRE